MKPRQLLKELEQVAQAVHISVRTRSFQSSALNAGGLCKLRGQSVVLLNSRSHEDERALVLVEILRQLDTSSVEMSDEARELITGQRTSSRLLRDNHPNKAGPGLRRARPKPPTGHE